MSSNEIITSTFDITKASVVGNVDLAAGHDWSDKRESFKLTVDGGTVQVVTLCAKCVSKAAVADRKSVV